MAEITKNVHPEFVESIYGELEAWADSEHRSIKSQVEWLVIQAIESHRKALRLVVTKEETANKKR